MTVISSPPCPGAYSLTFTADVIGRLHNLTLRREVVIAATMVLCILGSLALMTKGKPMEMADLMLSDASVAGALTVGNKQMTPDSCQLLGCGREGMKAPGLVPSLKASSQNNLYYPPSFMWAAIEQEHLEILQEWQDIKARGKQWMEGLKASVTSVARRDSCYGERCCSETLAHGETPGETVRFFKVSHHPLPLLLQCL